MRSFSAFRRLLGIWFLGFGICGVAAAATPEDFRLNSSTHRPIDVSALDLSTTTVTFGNDQIPKAKVAGLVSDLDAKAADNTVLHLSGAETVSGAKVFTGANTFVPLQSFNSIASSSVTAAPLSDPAAPTVTPIGAHGVSTWSYKIVAKLSDGSPSAASAAGSTAIGDDVLDATNKNSLTWPAVTGAATYDVYRTAVGVSPSTTGKIANVTTTSYVDAGAAGDSSVAPSSNATGQVTGRILDRGGLVFDVKAAPYFAKGDGIADDTAAFAAAYADALASSGARKVFIPGGSYRVNNLHVSGWGVDIEGAGKDATTIFCDYNSATVLQLGTAGGVQFRGKVQNLRVSRAAGTVPSNSIGISAIAISYITIQDVVVDRQGVGIKTSEGWSSFDVGLILNRVQVYNSYVHLWVKDIAEVFVTDSNFGVNGSENIAPLVLVQFEGITNDVRISKTQFIPRVSNSQAAAFKWINTSADNGGMYRFYDINLENMLVGFQSDDTVARINDLNVSGSRLTPNGKLFDFDLTHTHLLNPSFVNNSSMKSDTPSTLANARMGRFCFNQINGSLTFNGGSWTVSGNTFTTDTSYTGTFDALVLTNNNLVFDGTVPIALTVTGTGHITKFGNTADNGAQPTAALPGALTVTDANGGQVLVARSGNDNYSEFSLQSGTTNQVQAEILSVAGSINHVQIGSRSAHPVALMAGDSEKVTLWPSGGFSIGTPLDPGAGSLAVSGNLAVSGSINGGVIKPLTSAGTASFSLDGSTGATLTVANNGFAQPFGNADNFAGWVFITNLSSKTVAIFLVGGSPFTTLVSQTGTDFANGGAVAGHTDFYINGSGVPEINNKTGGSVSYRIMSFRMNTSH
jgi:Pectate lyase superfamily protein